MTTRFTTKTVVFSRAFVLNETEGEQQPGIYTVETEEEEIDVMSISAYRRVSTLMNRYDPYGRAGLARLGRSIRPSSRPPWLGTHCRRGMKDRFSVEARISPARHRLGERHVDQSARASR